MFDAVDVVVVVVVAAAAAAVLLLLVLLSFLFRNKVSKEKLTAGCVKKRSRMMFFPNDS